MGHPVLVFFFFFFAFFYFHSVFTSSVFLLFNFVSIRQPEIKKSVFISKPREFCASHYLGRILLCAYIIWYFSQISIFCTIPSGSSFPLILVPSYLASSLHSLIISSIIIGGGGVAVVVFVI